MSVAVSLLIPAPGGTMKADPRRSPPEQMTKWAEEYGPIFSLKLANQTMIVLTGAQEVKELLDRRSATTSDRPPLHVANELITNGHHLLAMNYGPRWRLVRKILHQYLTIRMCEEKHQFIQSAESTQMVRQALNLLLCGRPNSNLYVLLAFELIDIFLSYRSGTFWSNRTTTSIVSAGTRRE